MAARDLRIPAEVAEVLGASQVDHLLAGPWPVTYRCRYCHCRERLTTGVPTTAGIYRYTDGQALWFAHTACGPGAIITLPEPMPRPTPQLGEVAGIAATVTVPGSGIWPVILLELGVGAIDRQGDETIDLTMVTGIRMGMHPVANLLHPPPEDTGWYVQLPRPDRPGAVRDPSGEPAMEPLPPLPDDWLAAAHRHADRCGVYLLSGAGLSTIIDGTLPGDELVPLITQAGTDGRLLGVTAPVQP